MPAVDGRGDRVEADRVDVELARLRGDEGRAAGARIDVRLARDVADRLVRAGDDAACCARLGGRGAGIGRRGAALRGGRSGGARGPGAAAGGQEGRDREEAGEPAGGGHAPQTGASRSEVPLRARAGHPSMAGSRHLPMCRDRCVGDCSRSSAHPAPSHETTQDPETTHHDPSRPARRRAAVPHHHLGRRSPPRACRRRSSAARCASAAARCRPSRSAGPRPARAEASSDDPRPRSVSALRRASRSAAGGPPPTPRCSGSFVEEVAKLVGPREHHVLAERVDVEIDGRAVGEQDALLGQVDRQLGVRVGRDEVAQPLVGRRVDDDRQQAVLEAVAAEDVRVRRSR